MDEEDFPTDADLLVLQEALSVGEGREVTPEEVTALVQWVHGVLTRTAIVELRLDGRLLARRLPDGQFNFRVGRPGEAPTL